jgi:lysophospholipase L1-like esterase
MIYQEIELHNVAEAHPVRGGVLLQRVPEEVRVQLNPGAQMRVRQPDNAELRFLCDGGPVRVTLSSLGATDVTLFYGPFHGRQRYSIGQRATTIEIPPPSPRLEALAPSFRRELHFSPAVRRLILGGRQREPLILHGIEGNGLRPPAGADLPSVRYLAYGTSITHGFDAEGPHLSYVAQAAWHLGADLINLGVGGSAHCEHALADYIATRNDWHVATLALSANMQGFSLDEFYERVAYMVNAVSGADASRPVACITLYPYFRDLRIEDAGASYGGTPAQYRQALRDAVAACPHLNVHLIEGPEILTQIRGLTHDLIHPGDHGMIEMGRKLAARLAPLLSQGRLPAHLTRTPIATEP